MLKVEKIYLGDSVYAECDGYAMTLTTENGLPTDPSNRIVMEPEVVGKFFEFVQAHSRK